MGSYVYVDPTGSKRTVYFLAGGATGIRVLTPPTYDSPPSFFIAQSDPIQLSATSISLPALHISPEPSAVVYHFRPEDGFKQWDGVRKMTKVVRRAGKRRKATAVDAYRGEASSVKSKDRVPNPKSHRELMKRMRHEAYDEQPSSNEIFPVPSSTFAPTVPQTTTILTTTEVPPTRPPRKHAPLRSYTAEDEKYHVPEDFSNFEGHRDRFIYQEMPHQPYPNLFPLTFESVKILNRGKPPKGSFIPEESINSPVLATAARMLRQKMMGDQSPIEIPMTPFPEREMEIVKMEPQANFRDQSDSSSSEMEDRLTLPMPVFNPTTPMTLTGVETVNIKPEEQEPIGLNRALKENDSPEVMSSSQRLKRKLNI